MSSSGAHQMTSRWQRSAMHGRIRNSSRVSNRIGGVANSRASVHLVRIQDGLSDVVSSPVYVSTARFLSLCLRVLQPGMKELDQAARVFWISLVFCLRNSGGWVAVRLSTRSRQSSRPCLSNIRYLGIQLGEVSYG